MLGIVKPWDYTAYCCFIVKIGLSLMHKEFVVANDIHQLPGFAENLEAFCEEAGVPINLIYPLNLVLDEWLTNLISHAFKDDHPHDIFVTVEVGDEAVTMTVTDDGLPFNPVADAPAPPLEGEIEDRPIGGLGLHLIRRLMDGVNYETRADGRNCLTLTKRRNTDA
jgi:anti-sigma regulatory factor (Ser/Thr protein kinase)